MGQQKVKIAFSFSMKLLISKSQLPFQHSASQSQITKLWTNWKAILCSRICRYGMLCYWIWLNLYPKSISKWSNTANHWNLFWMDLRTNITSLQDPCPFRKKCSLPTRTLSPALWIHPLKDWRNFLLKSWPCCFSPS